MYSSGIRACLQLSFYRSISPTTLTCSRHFSISRPSFLRSTELKPEYLSSLRSNADRIWADIHSTADKFGPGRRYGPGAEQTGLTRLTLSDHDRAARDWFAETTKSLHCDVKVDSMGNMFAVRPGLKNDVPATFVGSHLDSQPLGGRFDGVLGVVAGLEMLRVLDENHIETEGPVGVVNWTNEEGARFPVSMMGSGVWAGVQDLNKIYGLKEVGSEGRTVKEELERIGYLGSMPADATTGMKMAGHFELHIEQGPKLVSNGEAVGAVDGVQAYEWYAIQIYGEASHAGATDFKYRSDALLFASEIVVSARRMAEKAGVLATVGILRAEPGSVNTVPDSVYLTLDIRHPKTDAVRAFAAQFQEWIKSAAENQRQAMREVFADTADETRGIRVEIQKTFENPAILFSDVAINCVKESASAVTGKSGVRRMTSGAGHDSVNTSRHCPTAMVFVPCRKGISHHPEEWCEKEHCTVGTDVILQSVLRFDQWRHKQGHFLE